MRFLGKLRRESSQALGAGIALTLLLAVACGAAATATPAPTGTPQPPVAQVATPTPAAKPAAAPTATPIPALGRTPAPAVSPGKVTLMTSNLGTERFDGTYGSMGTDYGRAIHGFLVSWDLKDGRMVIIPGIATKWEISSDGRTTTYTIRKGVKFHDGTELTGEDVLWSLRHFMGPQAKDYGKGPVGITYSKIMDRIEQTGPERVSVTTKVPSPELAEYASEGAGGPSVGLVLPKRATLHDEEAAAAYDRNPIGAGIIRLVKHVPSDVMSFERFADHYQQPKNGFPSDKRLNFSLLDLRLAPEEATRVAALRAGEADIARVTLGARKQVEAGGGRLVFGQEGTAFAVFQHGCWKPQFPCHDKRVRQALNYAIDKELMRDKLYGGPEVMQVKGWNEVTGSTIGYSPDLDPYPFDPVKARQLLAEAGYPGGKGFGNLIVNTVESPYVTLLPESAQLGADFWRRELGLDVEVKVRDHAALVSERTLNPQALHGQIWWRDNDTRLDAAGILRARYLNLETLESGGPATNSHNDPELFALMEKALSVFDPVEKEKVLNSTYRRVRDEAYGISLGYVNIPWGVGPRIARWEPYPLAQYASALHTITLK